jgi:hypothetical protein
MDPDTPAPGVAAISVEARTQLEIDHLKAENAKLELENQKLTLELTHLKTPPHWTAHVKPYVPVISTLLAVVAFCFGVWQYHEAETARRVQEQTAETDRLNQQRQADLDRLNQQKLADDTFRLNLRRDTAKPLWDKQLALYIEATEKAAVIATTDDDVARREAEKRFWVLYWGPLAAVEDVGLEKEQKPRVERAMVEFGRAIENKEPVARNRDELAQLSLNLAHAIRDALPRAFDVQATDLDNLRKKTP